MNHEIGRVRLDHGTGPGLADDMAHVGTQLGRGGGGEEGSAGVVFTAAYDGDTA